MGGPPRPGMIEAQLVTMGLLAGIFLWWMWGPGHP